MRKLTVEVGHKFNKLTVVRTLGVIEGFSSAECRCDCGGSRIVKVAELRSGHVKSCGCETWKDKSRKSSENIIGKKYSRLTVLRLIGSDNRKYRLCECKCDCGSLVKIRIARMLSGELQSCGCLQIEKAMENLALAQRSQISHGLSGTPTYRSWSCMMQRCFNPWNEAFHRYGGAGITACEFLKGSPLNLVSIIGTRPTVGHWIDRINNEGNYSCGACSECLSKQWPMNIRWATPSEQALNRSNNRMVEIDGITKVASEWCKILGLPSNSRLIYTYPTDEGEKS